MRIANGARAEDANVAGTFEGVPAFPAAEGVRLIRVAAVAVAICVLASCSFGQPRPVGPVFSAFVDSVLAVPENQRSARVDSFLAEAPSIPFLESDTLAYFIYRGDAGTVSVPGDMNGWDVNAAPMMPLEGTNLWYREEVFESQARLDYKLLLNGAEWILDPLNPHSVTGGLGANSELAMPGYTQPVEIEPYPDIEHGAILDHRDFAGTSLGDTRTIRVYLPAGYEASGDRRYGVMLFHDGFEYFSLGRARNVLDYLIAHGRIEPIVGVFVPPNRRNEEYGFGLQDAYESFIIDEVMPFVDTMYRTRPEPALRGTLGASLGGLISAQLCFRHPEQFGLCAPVSPSFQVNDGAILYEINAGPKKEVRFYVDWGTYEDVIEFVAEKFVDVIEAQGYEYTTHEWFEGHSWGSWRAHLSLALEYFFPPGAGTAVTEETVSDSWPSGGNFPNPFSYVTRIPVSLNRPAVARLDVYDTSGHIVWTTERSFSPGDHYFDFRDDRLACGNYPYRLHGDGIDVKGMITILR